MNSRGRDTKGARSCASLAGCTTNASALTTSLNAWSRRRAALVARAARVLLQMPKAATRAARKAAPVAASRAMMAHALHEIVPVARAALLYPQPPFELHGHTGVLGVAPAARATRRSLLQLPQTLWLRHTKCARLCRLQK